MQSRPRSFVRQNSVSVFGIGALSLTVLLLPLAAVADSCSLGAILPPCACGGNCFWSDFILLAKNIAEFLLGLLFAATLFMVFEAGFGMLTAMGNPEKIDGAKKWLGASIRGMGVVLLSWLLVGFVISLVTNGQGLFPGVGADKRITPLNWYQVEVPDECYPYSAEKYGGYTCTDTSDTQNWNRIQRQTYCFSNGRCTADPAETYICCDADRKVPFGQLKKDE